jgi:hypothetical protein
VPAVVANALAQQARRDADADTLKIRFLLQLRMSPFLLKSNVCPSENAQT